LTALYRLDTSAFIEAWHRLYPRDVFPGFWERLNNWIADGSIFASDEVYREIAKIDDDLHRWLMARKSIFRPLDEEVQVAATGILETFPRLVGEAKQRSLADPWVIAHAHITKATVVTQENPGNLQNPKIPVVCAELGIPCIRVVELLRQKKATFK